MSTPSGRWWSCPWCNCPLWSRAFLWAAVALATIAGVADAQELMATQVEAPFRVPYDAVTEHQFENGLRLVVVEDPTQPLVDIAAALDVGGRLESLSLTAGSQGSETQATGNEARRAWPPGIASFVASMLTRAGAGQLDGYTLAVQSEFRGADLRSFGGRHRSGVLASGLAEHLDQLVLWVAQALSTPRFEVAEIERYRENAGRSLEGRYRTTGSIAEREWQMLVLGADAPRAQPLRRADVDQWSGDELRAFHRAFYRPERVVVAVAGDVSASAVIEAFGRHLGSWSGTDAREPTTRTLTPPPASLAGPAEPGFYQFAVPAPQGTFVIGHLGLQRKSWTDREADAVAVMSEILAGGGPVSRLRGRLRDREGWVYGVSGSVGIGSIEPGLFQVAWSVAPENAVASLQAALEEIRRLRRIEPPAQEIAVARRTMVEALPSLFDTAEEVAGRYAEDLLLDRPHSFWQERAARLRAVDADAVVQAARRWLRLEDLVVVWVGPALPRRALRELGFQRTVDLPARDPVTLQPIARRPGR